MREFFQPWRRRIGIVLMLIWFPLLIGWLRSQFMGDVIAFQAGDKFWSFYSAGGEVSWNSFDIQPSVFAFQGFYSYPLDSHAPEHEQTHGSARYLAAIVPIGLLSAGLILGPSQE